MRINVVILSVVFLITQFVNGQDFKLMRFDENYSKLKDSTKTFYNNLKYTLLSENSQIYLSLGGEARGEVNYAVNEDWGEVNLRHNIFTLQRYHLHADLYLGSKVRVFGQLRSGIEDGRKNGPRSIDEDKLNIQNFFIDFVAHKKESEIITIRLGRQELRYGSGRLIDVREGPNLRLYFDGAKIAYKTTKVMLDAFIMADAIVKPGVLDNNSTKKVNFWGLYSTLLNINNINFDLYYLGINREKSKFNMGQGNELRHTFGSRFWKDGSGFVYNLESAYQFGAFSSEQISAFAISSEIGYVFKHTTYDPIIKLKTDYISGDKKLNDGKLGTLNAMYPNGGYFGMNPQAGPANLISIHPYISFNPSEDVLLTVQLVFNWRNTLNDGVYGPSGSLRLPSSESQKRYIGTAYMTTISCNLTKFINYNIGVQYFKTGSFINDVIPVHKDGFFIGSVFSYKF